MVFLDGPECKYLHRRALRIAALSRVRPPHLLRRQGTYYLRMRVPDDLIERVGVVEVRRSLGVSTFSTARLLALRYAARLKDVFEMINNFNSNAGQSKALVAACFHDLPGRDRCKRQRGSDEKLKAEETQALFSRMDEAMRQLSPHPLPDDDEPAFAVRPRDGHDIVASVVGLLGEQQKWMTDFMAPLLRCESTGGDHATDSAPPRLLAPMNPAEAVAVGPRMDELADRYVLAKRRDWTAKTLKGRMTQMGYLVEHLGPARRCHDVKPGDIREFRDAVRRLRSNHHMGAGKSFASRQTDAEDHRIAPKTAAVIFETCKAFFRWAKSEGYVAVNPAEDIAVDMPKRPRGEKARRPFTGAELETIFRAPVFTGCLSPRRRSDPGPNVYRDAYFWLPLVGFFSGMRMGEIIQLHMTDVHLDGPIPYLEVTDVDSDPVGSGNEKHVKSDAGIRKVPLHPSLMAVGFGEFVAKRRQSRRGDKRLFWEIGYGADGQASTKYSKSFGRLLDRLDLSDPALVFHSFRHAAEDAFRDALLPQYVIDRIIGHSDGATSAGYGEGVSLEVAYEAVKAMKLRADPLWLQPCPALP